MKKLIVLLSFFAVAVIFSACEKEKLTSTKDANPESTAYSVSQTVEKTSDTGLSEDNYINTTEAITGIADSTVPQSTKAVHTPSRPTIPERTISDTFVITKVSGTYLELRKVIYGKDTEKLVYCCDLGDFDGSADMNYKVGDEITLRYDADVAETYPLQLTVREIL